MIYGKILVVDDEEEMLRLLDIELTAEGYVVTKAKNGKEAIEKAKSILPDLILMDILMPDIDGAMAVRLLKQDIKTKNIPVIFLTAILKKEEETRKEIDKIPINNTYYMGMAKPLNAHELLKKIEEVLLKSRVSNTSV